ncbi:alpha/beta fold hydrolase [Nocardia sp. NPDC088792]|uniref:alpha/beta fold hydrolase n=1 Tax=Nocardia sp. NPDC088792 TaxID=3364332 RepID=UPI0038266425
MTPIPAPSRRAGSGEPVLLLHPFLLSHRVWDDVMDALSDSYDLFAVTLPGHWGGRPISARALDVPALADDVEAWLDEIGWDTCHIVGNSLGGWIAVELERRGRARSLTLIAPAGGWHHLSRTALTVGGKFLTLAPFIGLGRLLGDAFAKRRWVQRAALPIVSRHGGVVSRSAATDYVRAATHCAIFLPFLWSGLRGEGVQGLAEVSVPTTLLLAEHDVLLRNPSCSKRFIEELPGNTTHLVLPGVGHVPMYENAALVAAELRSAFIRHRSETVA